MKTTLRLTVFIGLTYLLQINQSIAETKAKGEWVTFCHPEESSHREAQSAINELHRRLFDPSERRDLHAVRSLFQSLIKGPCFEIALLEKSRTPKVLSYESFRIWWLSGGHNWLLSMLSSGSSKSESQYYQPVLLPPSERTFLSHVSHPSHPLSPLYCPINDEGCGREVDTWRRLADLALRGRYALKANTYGQIYSDNPSPLTLTSCSRRAFSRPKETRYRDWLTCISQMIQSTPAVPLGQFRAPSKGTLILFEYGSSGGGCVKARVYDLATGTAFLSGDCFRDGELSHPHTTGVNLKSEKDQGVISRTALRRALWMLMSADQMEQNIHVSSTRIEIPKGLKPRWKRGSNPEHISGLAYGLGSGGMSHYRILNWAWVHAKKVLSKGRIKLDGYHSVAHSYALDLLRLAETSFKSSCPPVSPINLTSHQTIGINRRSLEIFNAQWRDWSQEEMCKSTTSQE